MNEAAKKEEENADMKDLLQVRCFFPLLVYLSYIYILSIYFITLLIN